MRVWNLPFVGKPPLLVVDDRPIVESASGGGVRLELTGRHGRYAIELSLDEAERIAEAIAWMPGPLHGYPPPDPAA